MILHDYLLFSKISTVRTLTFKTILVITMFKAYGECTQQGRRNGFAIGGGGGIKLTNKKDTILYFSISVIFKIH